MRKVFSKINIGLVCAVLGFMLIYYAKDMGLLGLVAKPSANAAELSEEIDNMKKQIDDMSKSNNDLQQKISDYEKKATSENTTSKNDMDQLNTARINLGLVDVQGEGIIIRINLKSGSVLGNKEVNYISHKELIIIVNDLVSAGAEAVSINDKRLTPQSGIKLSSGISYILVNDEKVSPKAKIEIKAIGNKNNLYKAWEKLNPLTLQSLASYDLKAEKSDSVKIAAYTKSYYTDYLEEAKK